MTGRAGFIMACPECGGVATCDTVDNWVGEMQSGPYGCERCHWTEDDGLTGVAQGGQPVETQAGQRLPSSGAVDGQAHPLSPPTFDPGRRK